MFKIRSFWGLLVVGQLVGSTGYSQSYQYPELTVVPKATQVLSRHYKSETSVTRYWPIQASALATIAVSMVAQGESEVDEHGEPNKTSDIAGATMLVGSGWLLASSMLGIMGSGYKDGLKQAKKIKAKGVIGRLDRERIAEAVLEDAGSLSSKLSMFSVLTNLAANGAVASAAQDDETKIVAGIGVVMSLLPYFIASDPERIWNRHQEYKKRVYGPVAQLGVMRGPSGSLGPLWTLTLNL